MGYKDSQKQALPDMGSACCHEKNKSVLDFGAEFCDTFAQLETVPGCRIVRRSNAAHAVMA